MKKVLYILLVLVSVSVFFSSCTEEEVAPSTELNGGGGGSVDGKN
jgi:hypothetical protein